MKSSARSTIGTSAFAHTEGAVLITGASSGIGRALAEQFAAHGHGLALVGRDEPALSQVKARCRELGSPSVTIHVCDLAVPGEAAKLVSSLEGTNISVLVNNAGFGVHGEFANTDLEAEHRMVELQIQTVLTLTKGLLPAMIARKSGAILNIASVYSVSPVPRQVVYGACKAFLLSFAEGLASELGGTGVFVTTVCPGVTRTEFRKRSGIREKSAKSGMSAEEVAGFSYRAYAKRRRVAVPGTLNRVFVRACRVLPISWVPTAVERINRQRGLH